MKYEKPRNSEAFFMVFTTDLFTLKSILYCFIFAYFCFDYGRGK
jgi:hypothetical protein